LQTKEWIWEHQDYPNFEYDLKKLSPLMQSISRKQGELMAFTKVISRHTLEKSYLKTLESEIIASSAIEGEVLNRESVKSSIKERLGLDQTSFYKEKTKESHYVDILLEAQKKHHVVLTLEKLFFWHEKMFDTRRSQLWNIEVGGFRQEGTMQIVSGVVGKQKVFYEAPPRSLLEAEMKAYLDWFNSEPNSLLKAAIAHLWFVVIHPFDDGNGRITRAITEMVLSGMEEENLVKLYSFSKTIYNDRKGYYKALEATTGYLLKDDLLDITRWCEWFFKTLYKSLEEAIASIEHVVEKAKFWDKHRESNLNERQTKVMNTLLDKGIHDIESSLSTKKYKKIANTTTATASRDIKKLLTLGCITQIEGTDGRNVRYEVII